MAVPPSLSVVFTPEHRAELDKIAKERGLATATLVRSTMLGWLRDQRSNIPPITSSNP